MTKPELPHSATTAVYSVKRWDTKGIVIEEGVEMLEAHSAPGVFYARRWGQLYLRMGKDAFTDLEAAKARVRVLANRKLASLNAKIANIRTISKLIEAQRW